MIKYIFLLVLVTFPVSCSSHQENASGKTLSEKSVSGAKGETKNRSSSKRHDNLIKGSGIYINCKYPANGRPGMIRLITANGVPLNCSAGMEVCKRTRKWVGRLVDYECQKDSVGDIVLMTIKKKK